MPERNMNHFFKHLKDYCKNTEKESYVPARTALNIDKKDILIFEVDIDKVDFTLNGKQKAKELKLPLDKTFIEIPKWKIEEDKSVAINIGGILLYKQTLDGKLKDGNCIEARTFWDIYNKETGEVALRKPIVVQFLKGIHSGEGGDIKIIKSGSTWKKESTWVKDSLTGLDDKIKKNMSSIIRNIVIFILLKIEKKEYTSYKKWTPSGFETKEIVYSHNVISHKRHFWKDSGRFKIAEMSKKEWESEGYETHELVFKDGEVRRDVPFRRIGTFVVGKKKEKKEENRRVKVAKGRILRQEQKIYNILTEIFPGKLIRRHDRRTLKGLELDFNLPELRLGIEYDGEQHFDEKLYEKLYGHGFQEQIRRDRKKDKLCRKKNIRLIRIKYDEPLTKTHLKKRLV